MSISSKTKRLALKLATKMIARIIGFALLFTGTSLADELPVLDLFRASPESYQLLVSACHVGPGRTRKDITVQLDRHMLYRSTKDCVLGVYGEVCRTFAIDLSTMKCAASFYAGFDIHESDYYMIDALYPSFLYPIPKQKLEKEMLPIIAISRRGHVVVFETRKKLYVVEGVR